MGRFIRRFQFLVDKMNATLEHKVFGPGNSAHYLAQFQRWDSIAEIQAGIPSDGLEPETRPKDMHYGSDAPAYSIRNGEHILELYNLNDEEHFPDKSEVVRTIGERGYELLKLQDLEDKTRVIHLSDKEFNMFVTEDTDDASHITYELADVTKGIRHFKKKYGAEATKLFTAMHGKDAYSKQGVKGRFKEGQEKTYIYFINQSVTEDMLNRQEEGTKFLRSAYLRWLEFGSFVVLNRRFSSDFSFVSGVVKKSRRRKKKTKLMPYETAVHIQ